jgi:hypothetical protein
MLSLTGIIVQQNLVALFFRRQWNEHNKCRKKIVAQNELNVTNT